MSDGLTTAVVMLAVLAFLAGVPRLFGRRAVAERRSLWPDD
jgi:hypothetical protein